MGLEFLLDKEDSHEHQDTKVFPLKIVAFVLCPTKAQPLKSIRRKCGSQTGNSLLLLSLSYIQGFLCYRSDKSPA